VEHHPADPDCRRFSKSSINSIGRTNTIEPGVRRWANDPVQPAALCAMVPARSELRAGRRENALRIIRRAAKRPPQSPALAGGLFEVCRNSRSIMAVFDEALSILEDARSASSDPAGWKESICWPVARIRCRHFEAAGQTFENRGHTSPHAATDSSSMLRSPGCN